MDAIHGVTLEALAEMTAKHTAFQTQYGQPAFKAHFEQYLAGKGVDYNTFAHANNGWQERFQADPSGQLEAKFQMALNQQMMQAHMGDVRDMSQDQMEGVTLDQYARVAAELTQEGADQNAILAKFGIQEDLWVKANQAWIQAMSQDTNVTTQYGQLVAKYTPGFQEQMEANMAASLAAANARSSADEEEEEEKEYTFEEAMQELGSRKPRERWIAAHHLASFYDVADFDEEPHVRQATKAIPVLRECLEQHDEVTVSEAEQAIRDLLSVFGQYNDDVKGDIARCLGRAQDRLQNFQAAFAPIQDKAVPERVRLQSNIQDFTSLVETLEEALQEWDENAADAQDATQASDASIEGAASQAVARQSSGSILDKLLSLFR